MQLDDTDLAIAARDGDLAAFDEIVRRHERAALRIATVVAGSSRAADAAQEGFIRAYRHLDRYDPERPLRPWLLRIVANAARNEIRRVDRHRRIEMKVNDLTPDRVDAADPAAHLAAREAVARGFAGLDEADRLVLALRWFEECSEAEIASILEIAPGTVKSRLHRARQRLRARLVEGGDDEWTD